MRYLAIIYVVSLVVGILVCYQHGTEAIRAAQARTAAMHDTAAP